MASQSAFNNATGALTTLAALAMATGSGDLSFALSSFELVKQLFIGIVAGAVFGYVAALLIAHERLAFLADFAPMVTLAAVIGAYFAADDLQASGFTSVFVFGMVLGNRYWQGGVVLVAIFMVIVRPTVFLCALPDRRARWSFKETLFMCWTCETGVIPAALAGLRLGMRVPEAQTITSVTFIAVLMTILSQAPPTKWRAHISHTKSGTSGLMSQLRQLGARAGVGPWDGVRFQCRIAGG